MHSLCIFDLLIVLNNIQSLNVAVEMQQLVPFALMSSLETFLTAVNSMKEFKSSVIVTKFGVSQHIFVGIPSVGVQEFLPVGADLIHGGQMDGQA